ncbi:uncharacterized protein MYCFIDRAFT_149152 [Pseudocercospora fijiensis CIRAD86]|uniref:AAA+ ATPase domain-containing protein n=1 Tax=Pseudocercospora fijiensis (strain CIRAD86) TaxID=383855 RepID=N1Q794_PSEFD|nr:uncharacterized protein MYCFIDRAFT_149152 [Pseudocercospora fijiensis CIRAD86]EME88499.1 hypothetical protein MYCFIDRAFT_149152 [Pseudocercospora fijiensis CIRAD86]
MVMRSPFLKDVVRRLFENYPGEPSAHMEEPKYAPPFRPFFHQWAKLQYIYVRTAASDPAGAAQLAAVLGVLKEEIGGSSMQDIKNLARNGEVTFDSLWAMFPPGCPVISGQGSSQHLYLVDDAQYFTDREGRKVFQLVLKDIDHNGSVFGWRKSTNIVAGFDGTMGIDQLPAVPVHLHFDANAVEEAATIRGTRVAKLISEGVAYRSHEGLADIHSMGQRYLSGRVVADSKSYVQQTSGKSRLENETGNMSTSPGRLQALLPKQPNQQNAGLSLEGYTYLSVMENFNLHPVLSVGKTNLRETVDNPDDRSGSNLLNQHGWTTSVFGSPPEAFVRPIVRGYCLTSKLWATFNVTNISDITWNANAFDALVMQPARKKLLEALIKQQQIYKTDSQVDDVIAGKGQGLVLLLPGPPGTGKTLTAESIADRLQIPLYAVSASELGDTVAAIEEKFGQVLQLAAQWNAVLLLDEADAFLEKRVDHFSARDRNKRVAAFLRILEYYKGILILTTNRMISFDDAFYSRIHLTLPFKALDVESRKGIWKNFLRGAEISEDEIREFAEEDLNGRQIKNIMKMARLLAKANEEALGAGHVREVMGVAREDAEGLIE